MEKVKMNKIACSIGKDEMYIEFFQCPECRCDAIISSFNYCPGCGKKIEWFKHDSDKQFQKNK